MRVLLLLAAAASLFGADPTDWITDLGGKFVKDPAGNVVEVNLRGSWVYDSQLIDLARMPKLERLDLSHTRISDEGMQYLQTAPAITDLNLFYAEQVTDQGITAIKGWKHLRRLTLRGTRISDGALDVISHLTQLEALDIANTPVTDNGLDSLITLTNLKELTLGHRYQSDNEVEMLRLLPTLTYLDLSGPVGAERPDMIFNMGGASSAMREDLVRAIAGLKNLRVLRLGYTNISGEELRTLSGSLAHVERLGLEVCPKIDDAATAELARWKSLKDVDLQETRVTDTAVSALRHSRPDLVILSGAGPWPAAASRVSPTTTPAQ